MSEQIPSPDKKTDVPGSPYPAGNETASSNSAPRNSASSNAASSNVTSHTTVSETSGKEQNSSHAKQADERAAASIYGEGASTVDESTQSPTSIQYSPYTSGPTQDTDRISTPQRDVRLQSTVPTSQQYSPWASEGASPSVVGSQSDFSQPVSSLSSDQRESSLAAHSLNATAQDDGNSSRSGLRDFAVALFDFSFTQYITPKFAKVIYTVAVALTAVFIFCVVIGALGTLFSGGVGLLEGLIIISIATAAAAGSAFLNIILLRVGLELAVSVVRLAQFSAEKRGKAQR